MVKSLVYTYLAMTKNVRITSITIFMNTAAIFTWYYLVPVYLKTLGASDWLIGIAYTLLFAGFTVSQIFGGYLSDIFGRKVLIVLPTYIGAILYLLMALIRDPVLFIIVATSSEVVSSIQMPSFVSLIFESSGSSSVGKSFSILEGAASAGLAVGTISGAFMLKIMDIPELFLISAAVIGITAVMRHFFLEETLAAVRKKISFKISVSTNMLWLIASGIFYAMVLNTIAFGPFPTLFYKEVRSFSNIHINFVFFLANMAAAIGSILGAKIINQSNVKKVFSVNMIVWAASIVIWLALNGSIIVFTASFVFIQYCIIASDLMVSSMSTSEERGKMIGLYKSIVGMISAIGPTAGMWIKVRYGYSLLVAFIVLTAVISVLLVQKVRISSSSGEDT